MGTDEVVRAAAAVLGEPLCDPVDLGGSWRSAVLRCSRARGAGTVVVKAYPPDNGGRRGFAAEAAGLAFCGFAPGSCCPRLLGADSSVPLVVMSDLGTAPSLADLLLDPSAAGTAAQAWVDWAAACGRLAAFSAGREGEFARAPADDIGWLRRALLSAADIVRPSGAEVPAGLAADLDDVLAGCQAGPRVFSPGDLCPDNSLITAEGVRLVDFEDAGFHSVFLDAAYLRMPFSSCWCVLRMPAALAAAGESAYRSELAGAFPELESDTVWEAGVLRASAAWTIHAMSYLLDRAVAGEESMEEGVPAAPGRRQLLRYRWQRMGDALTAAGELPALAELMRRLLAATEPWRAPAMPLYPAFTASPH